jgi:hypothetical protein
VSEVSEDGDPDVQDLCNYCLADAHCDGTVSWCNCTCGWGDGERDDDEPGSLTGAVRQQGLIPYCTQTPRDYVSYVGWYRPEIAWVTATTQDGEPVL